MNDQTEQANKEEEPLQEIKDLSKPDFIFVPKERHTWRQQGYNLICQTCDLEHGIYIGNKKLMIGETDNGDPILKERV